MGSQHIWPSSTFRELLRRSTSFFGSLVMPSPPSFDPTRGDTVVPRERSATPGASSSSGPVRLTPGPGASLPTDLTEEPTVAHIPDSDDSGYVIMYVPNRTMTMDDRSVWPSTGRVVCPHFALQPGIPPDRCILFIFQEKISTNKDFSRHAGLPL